MRLLFLFTDTATTESYPLSLHDALPISFAPPTQASNPPTLAAKPVATPVVQLPAAQGAGAGGLSAGDPLLDVKEIGRASCRDSAASRREARPRTTEHEEPHAG